MLKYRVIIAASILLMMLVALSLTALADVAYPLGRWDPRLHEPAKCEPHPRYPYYRYAVINSPYSYSWVYAPYGVIPYGYQPVNPAAEPPEAKPANRASLGNITWSTVYLYQVYINGRSLDFRVFGDDAKQVFLLSFQSVMNGVRMVLKVRGTYNTLLPVFTEEALNVLAKFNVTEVVIKNNDQDTVYTMDELRLML